MTTNEKTIIQASEVQVTTSKFKDYLALVKFRLTFSVVLSALLGYIVAVNKLDKPFELLSFISLLFGGFLVVASSNGLNQIIEKNYDKLMQRTVNRPIASNRMGMVEALLFCVISGIIGIFILGYFLNAKSAWLGFTSLLVYAFVYTPLKRYSSIAVFVGAFPGAIPPMLGWIAVSDFFDIQPGILFFIQFFWQFPHFWSIAWLLHDDYQKAGYMLLPSPGGRDKKSALYTIVYTFALLAASIFPYFIGMASIATLIYVAIAGSYFLFRAWKLYITLDVKEAKLLMFTSLLYVPLLILTFLI